MKSSVATTTSTDVTTDTSASDPSIPPMGCPIIQLNFDVLNYIVVHMSPVDHMMFRYTCKTFFSGFNTHEQFTPQNLTSQDCRCYRLQLHRDDPTSYLCLTCDDFHPLDERNLPFKRKIICPEEEKGKVFGSTLTGPFQLDHGHVQLACKLAQMDQATLPSHCKRFLGSILSDFHLPTYHPPGWSNEPPLVFRAQARIIQGQLYLKRTWQCGHSKLRSGSGGSQSIFGAIQVCPHLGTGDTQPTIVTRQCSRLRCGIIDLMFGPPGYKHLSCWYCNTDISLHAGLRHMTLQVWQLLGGYSSDSYKYWKAQNWIVDWSSRASRSLLDYEERIHVRQAFELAEKNSP